MQLTKRLAELVVGTGYEDLPPEVIEYTKLLALSCFGATVGGSNLRAGRIIIDYVQAQQAAPEAGVHGAGFRTTPEYAALANGTTAHATELEDDSFPEGVSAYTLFPPFLALAEALSLGGRELIEAFVVGQEVQSRLGRGCLKALDRGYLNLSLYGVLGVAAGAARMLKLDVDKTRMALALAADQASGIFLHTGTMAHFFAEGYPGRDGIFAARLAQAGFTGDPNILERHGGFLETVGEPGAFDPEAILAGWGEHYRVMDIGIKQYPCCFLMQRVIDGVVDLKQTHQLDLKDIREVELESDTFFLDICSKMDPVSSEETRFSPSHAVAAALLEPQPRIFMDTFTDERVHDPRFVEVRRLVKVTTHPEWKRGLLIEPHPITIRLRDGREVRKEVMYASGTPPNYMPWEGVVKKFRGVAGAVLSDQQMDR
ncbi:MAG: MmgE/PrpD family protein, partial [Dehalococcoidia bacterium]